MDPLLLKYYNRELQYIREMGGEFAREFPKIAGRLGLDEFECADPYVERLLEGFAFLAARVQLKLDAEFPRFTEHLLETVYPHYLAPTPSMTVVQFQPDLTEGELNEGFSIPRDTALHSVMGPGDQTACEYRTAHETTLWPLELTAADYVSRDVAATALPPRYRNAKSVLRLRLHVTAGLEFNQLALESLPIFLRGGEERSSRLYEQLFSNLSGVVVLDPEGEKPTLLGAECVRRVGFADEQALLPVESRSFQGYRLLHEYFAFPRRFMFFELTGLSDAVSGCDSDQLEVLLVFDQLDGLLENAVDASDLALFCTPAINLFPQRADRIHLNRRDSEFHVVPDRTRPLDLEVYQLTGVTGYDVDSAVRQQFRSFYAASDTGEDEGDQERAYYTVRRAPRLLSSKERRAGPRTSYFGSEVFLALVDAHDAPYRYDLSQLEIKTLCTNRDLPLYMPVGKGKTDFNLEIRAPVDSVRCVAGPSEPRPSFASTSGDAVWRLISHLSLNYLSLVNTDARTGAAALRDLLKLYGHVNDTAVQKQIDGVKSVASRPIVRRLSESGPLTFGRGLEITLTCDEAAFEGSGMFLLGAVLAQFFSRYVSINSFTETVLRTLDRGEVVRWPATIGRRQIA
jgi:type VI secretion system protein ImpG